VAWGEREETIGAVEHDRAPRRDQAAAIDERGLPFDRTVSADREKRCLVQDVESPVRGERDVARRWRDLRARLRSGDRGPAGAPGARREWRWGRWTRAPTHESEGPRGSASPRR